MRILNCRLTKSDTDMITPFGQRPDKTWSTRCEVRGTSAYSLSSGMVVAIHKGENGRRVVNVQYNRDTLVRYGNLQQVTVFLGERVVDGQQIGTACKSVHFELCKKSVEDTRFPVRVGQQTYYKVDPTDLLTMRDFLDNEHDHDRLREYYSSKNSMNLTFDMFDEVGNSR